MPNGLKESSDMNIGILLDYDEKWMGGVNYIKNFIKTIAFLPKEKKPHLIIITNIRFKKIIRDQLNHNDKIEVKTFILPRVVIFFLSRPLRIKVQDFFRYFQIKSIARSMKIDILFPVTNPRDFKLPTKLIGWIPDFQHLYLQELFSKEEIATRTLSFTHLAESVHGVVVSSNVVKQDFEKIFPWYKGNIFVYSFCTVLENKYKIKRIEELTKEHGISPQFFYLPNQFWVHKNHWIVFRALAMLKEKGINIQVVCTGSSHEYRNQQHFQQLMEYKEKNQLDIINLGLVSQEIQYSLYCCAHAVIQPSLFEGWSSIVEDAKAFQKTIILSDLPVHREQNPSKVVYFDPNDVNDLARKMLEIWSREPEENVNLNELFNRQIQRIKENALVLEDVFGKTLSLGNMQRGKVNEEK